MASLLLIPWVVAQIGKRYWWGANGPDYYDCSGFVLAALREIFKKKLPDMRSYDMKKWPSVSWEEALPGDVLVYDGHVDLLCHRTEKGDWMLLSCGGGGSSTKGDKQTACVRVLPRGYRTDPATLHRCP